jgi:hypothetical protein
MNGVAQHQTRRSISDIDIQLWAREQRRRWFVRTCGTLLRKFALRSWVILRLVARACVSHLRQSVPPRRDSGAQSGYHGTVATWP